MAVGTADIGLEADIFPVTTFTVLTHQHFTLFPADLQQELSAFGADVPGQVVMGITRFTGRHLPDQSGGGLPDLLDELLPALLSPADGIQSLLPFCREQGLLQRGRDQLHDLGAL